MADEKATKEVCPYGCGAQFAHYTDRLHTTVWHCASWRSSDGTQQEQSITCKDRCKDLEIERLRAAVSELYSLWPAERWATLSGICRHHPIIDETITKGTDP